MPFWMDVFCIPVKKEGDERRLRLKNRAISLTTPTYSLASGVLMLDSEIEKLPYPENAHGIRRATAQAQLMSCGWMGRSWTLQEEALAMKL